MLGNLLFLPTFWYIDKYPQSFIAFPYILGRGNVCMWSDCWWVEFPYGCSYTHNSLATTVGFYIREINSLCSSMKNKIRIGNFVGWRRDLCPKRISRNLACSRYVEHGPHSCQSGLPLLIRTATWLILPVVICLSQRLSHACLSTSLTKVKPRMAH